MRTLETGLLEWAEALPLWQRDLLRRIAQGELISVKDYRAYADHAEYIESAKSTLWLIPRQHQASPNFTPINASHLQSTASDKPPVIVNRVTHIEGANNIAPGAFIEFNNSGLTIIAGENGSGKSGYVRILKQVAVSRGPEKVLSNVFRPTTIPKATINYQEGTSEAQDFSWQSDIPTTISPLQRVRVFDTKSATAQLAISNEIAFVPSVLQVLADYTSALKSISDTIESDIQQASRTIRSWPELDTGIGHKLFESLGKKEGLVELRHLVQLTDEAKAELEAIPSKILELTVGDPAKRAVQARGRADQLSLLARNLDMIMNGLSEGQVTAYKHTYRMLSEAQIAVDEASQQFKQNTILPHTGNEKWRRMWIAAREFFDAEPNRDFPDLSDNAVCALCQQPIDNDTRDRLESFAKFMKGVAQTELQIAKDARQADIATLKVLPIDTAVNQILVDLVTSYDKTVGKSLSPLMERAAKLRNWLMILDNDEAPEDAVEVTSQFEAVIEILVKSADVEKKAAVTYSASDTNAVEATKLQERVSSLNLRQKLFEKKSEIESQHDLDVNIDCLKTAARTCATNSASRRNSDLSQEYVSKVCTSFANEANALGLDRVPIELVFDKTSRGVSYIKVRLVGAPDKPVEHVLSEGQQRVAAIAGFFADLTESGDDSTLVFDDPVCSLDQSYREAVAKRLLLEAEKRQVLVFSHDFTFVQYLYEQRKQLDKDKKAWGNGGAQVANIGYAHIVCSQNGVGVITTADHWCPVLITERIKRLNERAQNAQVLYRDHNDVEYSIEALAIMASIRKAWEYSVEQVLLNNVVKRHERPIETQRLKDLKDICDEDIAAVDAGMAFCSRWLDGHAAPINDGTQMISPQSIMDEIRKITDFCDRVKKRRK